MGDRLVGSSRMLSDGHMYSAICDVIVDPEFQRRGAGKAMMQKLMDQAPTSGFFLTSMFASEEFYRKIGFRKHKAAYAKLSPRLKDSAYLE